MGKVRVAPPTGALGRAARTAAAVDRAAMRAGGRCWDGDPHCQPGEGCWGGFRLLDPPRKGAVVRGEGG